MPAVEFPYYEFRIKPSEPFPNGQVALRPVAVSVLVASTGKRLRCLVCLDSGADSCVIPSNFAPVLGLDLSAMKTNLTSGVGTNANVTAYDYIEIDLGSGIRFRTYAGFTPGLNALGLGLLGQSGFFELFNVCFCHKQRRFTVETS